MYLEPIMNEQSELIFSLLAAANSVEGRLSRVVSNVKGVSFTEYCLLKHLGECHNASATRVELASAVHLTPSAITRALKPLEKIGYVITEKGERDARQSIASLTDAGKALVSDADQLVHDEISGFDITDPPPSDWVNMLNELALVRR